MRNLLSRIKISGVVLLLILGMIAFVPFEIVRWLNKILNWIQYQASRLDFWIGELAQKHLLDWGVALVWSERWKIAGIPDPMAEISEEPTEHTDSFDLKETQSKPTLQDTEEMAPTDYTELEPDSKEENS